MFCLPSTEVNKFLEQLKSGKIDPAKLSEMSSIERREFFKQFMSESSAKQTNALFESKLLLKNQQKGIINWAKSIAGLKPEVLRDMVTKVENMTEVLQPDKIDSFLSDLVEQRLGMTVTPSEASKIVELSKALKDAKEKMMAGGDRLEYGNARVAFGNYIADLKNNIPVNKNIGQYLLDAASASKSVKASLDNSAIFRQGWKTMITNPNLWFKNAKQSFKDIKNTFQGQEVLDAVNADLYSRPNYELYRRAKLAIGVIEEAYPSSLPEKLPIIGKAFKASQSAFTGFVMRQRADIFDKYIEIAKNSDIPLDKAQLESIGSLVNSLTGRGRLGKFEPAADTINSVFFSPRLLKSNIDILTAHQFQKGITPFARRQAAINLMKILIGGATILTIANAIRPGSVETDPRSADFGKMKIGDTRFDITGGMSGLIILMARMALQGTKDAKGKIVPINTDKFGSKTTTDLLVNFFENKLSPVASVLNDLLIRHRTFDYKNPTLKTEAVNLLVPLPITNYMELKDNPNSANIILSMIADALGIGVNTYTKK